MIEPMATIRLHEVSKTFPGASAPALKALTLTIPHGETVAVVGPSGSGKSTLLRVIAGLETIDSGQIFYDDREMSAVPPKQRHIGMVFQNYALYPHFAGHGNLSFFFRLRKSTDAETEERIRITSQLMGLGFEELLKRKPGTLSGGQQQRLAIGRAIVRNPQLLLMDEPLSNLDAKLRTQTRIEIKRLLGKFQITSLYVTHDQSEAIALGDQIAVMRAGQIEQIGPIHTLLDAPVNAFVAGFIGTPPMNLLRNGVVRDGQIDVAGQQIPLPPRLRSLLYREQAVIVGIRPEAATLWQAGLEQAGVRWSARIEATELDLGRRIQWLHCVLGEERVVISAAVERSVAIGESVDLYFPIDQLFVFDATTGLRIGGEGAANQPESLLGMANKRRGN